jgi:glutamate N-acetyltransferase/amino-acid N-acetyltransferase
MTFNNLTVDGDTSTNDMVLILANGSSGVALKNKKDLVLFEQALFDVCNTLCAKIAEDGEGATKRIEINVTGGKTYDDCKAAAKAVANSNLVKTAIFGNDPNWGRILCAIGYSGARFSGKNISVSLCGTQVFKNMAPVPFRRDKVSDALKKKIVIIDIDLGHAGKTCAVAHTCDLSYEYIKINAEYHT